MSAAANGPNPIVAARSAEVRTARSEIRRNLLAGRKTLVDVLIDPPECLSGVSLFTLLTWRRSWGRTRQWQIGAWAIRDNVNLAITVGRASRRSLDWLVALDRADAGRHSGGAASKRYEAAA